MSIESAVNVIFGGICIKFFTMTPGPMACAASGEGAMAPTARPREEEVKDSSVSMPRNVASLHTDAQSALLKLSICASTQQALRPCASGVLCAATG